MISCRIVELDLVTNNIKSQNSYEPSVVACRINWLRVWVTDYICGNSCRFVEFGLASANKGQNFHEPSVVACRINLEFE